MGRRGPRADCSVGRRGRDPGMPCSSPGAPPQLFSPPSPPRCASLLHHPPPFARALLSLRAQPPPSHHPPWGQRPDPAPGAPHQAGSCVHGASPLPPGERGKKKISCKFLALVFWFVAKPSHAPPGQPATSHSPRGDKALKNKLHPLQLQLPEAEPHGPRAAGRLPSTTDTEATDQVPEDINY